MILGAVVLFAHMLPKVHLVLVAELKEPYEPWEARERECKAMDEGK